MKVVHLCLACFFPDGFTYQENLLPKWHKRLGFDVEVIASLLSFDKSGHDIVLPEATRYRNEYDIPVTRLAYKEPRSIYRKLNRFIGLADALEKASPDILFIHGCQFLDMDVVVSYLRDHPGIRVFVDNHADYSNSARKWVSKHILHRIVWKHCAHIIEPYTTTFWGVLPARVDFLVENYGLPRRKCDLLVMGADDDEVERASDPRVRAAVRERYGVTDSDFLVVTGGKIDLAKTQTLTLMKCVADSENEHLKLLVFGSVSPELKERFDRLSESPRIIYAGWMDASGLYDCFASADLICFPGRHSVFWEQAVAQGKPLLVKRWDGTLHVDCGGNVRFLEGDDPLELTSALKEVSDPAINAAMVEAASKSASDFLYSKIAERSVSIADGGGFFRD